MPAQSQEEGAKYEPACGQKEREEHPMLCASARKLRTTLELVADCLKKHARYGHQGKGYLEEADELIQSALKP